jgi:hypothetical protein
VIPLSASQILRHVQEGSVLTIDIHRPYRAIVTIVSTETLSVVREPHVNDMIFGASKEQVSLGVEFDLR